MTFTKLFLAANLLSVLLFSGHAHSVPSHVSSLPLPGGSWINSAKPQSIEVEEIEGDDEKFLLKAKLAAEAGPNMWKCDTIVFSPGDRLANDFGRFVREDMYEKICDVRRQNKAMEAFRPPLPSDSELSLRETLLLAFVPLPSGLVLGYKWKQKLNNTTKELANVRALWRDEETKLKQLKEKLVDLKKKGLDQMEDADLEELEAFLEDV